MEIKKYIVKLSFRPILHNQVIMNLKNRIVSAMKTAMKSGERETVRVLRMLNAKILEKEIEFRQQKGREYQLNDEETLRVISSYAKQCQQSIDSYQKGGRQDLVIQEKKELSILQVYLPKQLSKTEIEILVDKVIKENGATSLNDIGLVMKAILPKIKGATDGKTVNQIVRGRLTNQEQK